jgi:hypothetical protein
MGKKLVCTSKSWLYSHHIFKFLFYPKSLNEAHNSSLISVYHGPHLCPSLFPLTRTHGMPGVWCDCVTHVLTAHTHTHPSLKSGLSTFSLHLSLFTYFHFLHRVRLYSVGPAHSRETHTENRSCVPLTVLIWHFDCTMTKAMSVSCEKVHQSVRVHPKWQPITYWGNPWVKSTERGAIWNTWRLCAYLKHPHNPPASQTGSHQWVFLLCLLALSNMPQSVVALC